MYVIMYDSKNILLSTILHKHLMAGISTYNTSQKKYFWIVNLFCINSSTLNKYLNNNLFWLNKTLCNIYTPGV